MSFSSIVILIIVGVSILVIIKYKKPISYSATAHSCDGCECSNCKTVHDKKPLNERSTSDPKCTVETWIDYIINDPSQKIEQKVPVRDLTKACSRLFKAAVPAGILGHIGPVFNTKASAKCSRCSATMNGEYLAFLSNIQSDNVIVNTSNPDQIRAIMNNTCPYCSHTEWIICWDGISQKNKESVWS